MKIQGSIDIHSVIQKLKIGAKFLTQVKWGSPSGLHISLAASLLGATGLILALKDGKVGNFSSFGLPWSPDEHASSDKNWVVPGLQNLGNNCFLNVVLQVNSISWLEMFFFSFWAMCYAPYGFGKVGNFIRFGLPWWSYWHVNSDKNWVLPTLQNNNLFLNFFGLAYSKWWLLTKRRRNWWLDFAVVFSFHQFYFIGLIDFKFASCKFCLMLFIVFVGSSLFSLQKVEW